MQLRVVHPAIGEIQVALVRGGLVAGREGGNADLDMRWDRRVSRRHVRFWVEGDEAFYEDLNSRNGTWEDGQRRVGRQPLREGSWLLVGETFFSLSEAAQLSVRSLGGLDTLDVPAEVADLRLPPLHAGGAGRGDQGKPAIAAPLAAMSHGPGVPSEVSSAFGANTSAAFAALTAPPSLESPPSPISPAIGTGAPPRGDLPLSSLAINPEEQRLLARFDARLLDRGFGEITEEFAALPAPGALLDTGSRSTPAARPASGTTAPLTTMPTATAPPPITGTLTQPSTPAADPGSSTARPSFVATLLGPSRVSVKIADRHGLRALWTEHVVRNGLFVKTDSPLPHGSPVEVAVETPAGSLKLSARVVHVLDGPTARQFGRPAGMGLQFGDVTPAAKDAVLRWIGGLTDDLHPDPGVARPATSAAPATLEHVLTRAREFIARMEANDLYSALGLSPSAPDREVTGRLADLKRLFAGTDGQAKPPQLARLEAARKLLERCATVVGTPERRLEYDMRQGHVRAEERVAAAKDKKGPSLAELRRAWHAAHPARLARAAELIRAALEAKKRRELVEAIRLGREALDLDPFQDELRRTVNAWHAMVQTPS